MKYEEPEAGEWIKPVRRGYKLSCCDCGLVHTLNFRIRKRRIQFQVFRNNRSTGQIRRYMKNVMNECNCYVLEDEEHLIGCPLYVYE